MPTGRHRPQVRRSGRSPRAGRRQGSRAVRRRRPPSTSCPKAWPRRFLRTIRSCSASRVATAVGRWNDTQGPRRASSSRSMSSAATWSVYGILSPAQNQVCCFDIISVLDRRRVQKRDGRAELASACAGIGDRDVTERDRRGLVRSGSAPLVVNVVLALSACGLLESKPPSERAEGNRLGMFSGESGTFVWHGSGEALDSRPSAGGLVTAGQPGL